MTLLRTHRRHLSPTGVRARECDGHHDNGGDRPAVRVVVTELPGAARLRTRLSPPWSPEQAALLADAALADTLRAVAAMASSGPAVADRAALAASPQDALVGSRLRRAPSLLVGTATPQVGPGLLERSAALLDDFDAVLGPTASGGWWAFGLRQPAYAVALSSLPEILSGTGSLTLAVLRLGVRVAMLPTLTDVTGMRDAREVAGMCPAGSQFAAAVDRLTPVAVPAA
jgi:glycosyltransferase A (GT-A) superfamily protein (DUF2064 family)